MSLKNPTRRDVLKKTGIAGTALVGVTGTASAVSEPVEVTFYETSSASNTNGSIGNAMVVLSDALTDIGISDHDFKPGTDTFSHSASSLSQLHNQFQDWLLDRSDKSTDANILLGARDNLFSGNSLSSSETYVYQSAYVVTTCGAESIKNVDTNAVRGQDWGDFWVAKVLDGCGSYWGADDGDGRLYDASSEPYGASQTATPMVEYGTTTNNCGSSQIEGEISDTNSWERRWTDCAGDKIYDIYN